MPSMPNSTAALTRTSALTSASYPMRAKLRQRVLQMARAQNHLPPTPSHQAISLRNGLLEVGVALYSVRETMTMNRTLDEQMMPPKRELL
ncbi:hypothetical protein HN51_069442, partial [Arachis hypogaea]